MLTLTVVKRGRSILMMLALLVVVAGVSSANAATPVQKQPCTATQDFKEDVKLGMSCQLADGTWMIRLRDGHLIQTHGPDFEGLGGFFPLPEAVTADVGILSTQVCVPTTSYHGLIIYANPSDQPDRYDTVVATVRGYFQGAQDKLNSEALTFGVSASYKMACDPDGRVTVRRETLPTALNSSNYNTIVSDLRARGYTSTFAQYWIYFDGRIIACGQGEFHNDDRPVVDNQNNRGPRYAISYGCNALMHENGHNMGAVQNNSPNASGAAHCNDDRDVMCYNDGGPNSGGYRNNVCTDLEHWDCNHDDYFHPNPPAGSYLATHWNLAACYNRFIERSGCGGATSTPTSTTGPTRTSTPPSTAGPTRTPTPTATGTQAGSGLWARYAFDGNANDSSGAGRNGTLVNGPTFVAGRVGQAVNLAGGAGGSASQHVSLPTGIVNGLTNFTIASWVRLDTTGAWRRIFDFGTGTTANMFLVPSSGSNVRFAITTGGSGAEQRINGTPVLPTAVWKHVAVTKNGNVSTLYVDGVQVSQNTNTTLSPSSLGNTTRNWIGRSQYTGDAFLDG